MRRASVGFASLAVALVLVAPAFTSPQTAIRGQGWLPHEHGAHWTYSWSDSTYSPTPTKEKVTVSGASGSSFTLAWTSANLGNPATAVSGNGTVSFQETDAGLVNTNWTSSPPPAAFPVLCDVAASCGNSLASFYYNVIWGSRQPTLAEPLLGGTSWTTTGGAQNDVGGTSVYLGIQSVSVPAFNRPVRAAVIRTQLSQVGAIGDPYGSGVRTVWWVYGVGPVKMVFRHAGGASAPVTSGELISTDLVQQVPPPDVDYFPLRQGLTGRFQWTNATHLKKPEVQSFKVDQAANGSAVISVASVSGPIKTKGNYSFTLRAGGVSNLAGAASAATLLSLPPLGPKSLPATKRRHFFTIFDLMDFGFNPILPAYGVAGTHWSASRGSSDFQVYGVTGTSTVMGVEPVSVPAGTYRALVIRTTLDEPGFPYGSGVRTSWFAPGKGLVKLVFKHADGSTSQVVRLS